MKSKIILILGVLIVLGLIIGLWFFYSGEKRALEKIQTFVHCAENGFPVQESYPRRCSTPDGRTFTEIIEQNNPNDDAEPPSHELITVITPRAGETISSPLSVTGVARGYWYFEASFPVELLDAEGKQLAIVPAQAIGEWMTEEFVPFSITLNFENPIAQEGTLVFHKDNASGLPEHDDQFAIPVMIGVTN